MRVNFIVSNHVYEMEGKIKTYLEKQREIFFKNYIKNKKFFDNINCRVKDIDEGKDQIDIYIEGGRYKDYIKTNIFYNEEIYKKGIRDKEFEELRCDFENHLGMQCMLKTLDNKYLITKRGKHLVYGAGKSSISFSGAIEGLKTGNIKDNLYEILFKESEEELGLTKNDYERIKLLGIMEDETRGFKPEMLFLAETFLSSDDVKERMETAMDADEIESFSFEDVERVLDLNVEDIYDESLRKFKEYIRLGKELSTVG